MGKPQALPEVNDFRNIKIIPITGRLASKPVWIPKDERGIGFVQLVKVLCS